MNLRWSHLWTWRGEIDRSAFLFWGFLLFALKYNLDRLISWRVFERRWSLLDYTRAAEYLWQPIPTVAEGRYYLFLLAIALPFMMAGVLLTIKRLRSAALPLWLVVLFFAPVVKLVFFCVLLLLPPRSAPGAGDAPEPGDLKGLIGTLIPHTPLASAAAGILVSTGFAALCAWLGTTVLRQYGWSLFVGLPFSLGFFAVLIYGYHARRSFWSCIGVSLAAALVAGVALLVVAIEGLICLVMAAPLAGAISAAGGWVAFQIQSSYWWNGVPPRVFCVAAVFPLLLLVEKGAAPSPVLFEVKTRVIVDAPPPVVWLNVVSFAELPAPTELLFRAGIAYPVRARILGTGPGAERHCEFSTGVFVEPISVWDEPRLLKFSVTSNPAPMQEWTPYADLEPAHLDGFLESRAGQFLLTPLPDGRTRLEGTTWYFHHMWPATYWRWWADFIIHKIHLRVLQHVKRLSETP